jgi:hypothetical protein
MDLRKMKRRDVNMDDYLLQMAAAATAETYSCRIMANFTTATPLTLTAARVLNCSTNSVTGVHYMG